MKEIFISHIYEKEGKEFNKEYYDLYWSSFLIKIKFLVTFEYLALAVYSKIYNSTMGGVINIINSLLLCFVCLLIGFVVWVIWIAWFQKWKYNKKLEKLVSIKKDNFVTYTGEEKKILEQND